jgi:hypothetical protein
MVVDPGEKIHVIERRRFESDPRRHFFGVVDRSDGAVVRVTGYIFVYDSGSSTYVRSDKPRTRLISLTSSGLIINVVPGDVEVDAVRYSDDEGRLELTDGAGFSLDINEFGRFR